MRKKSKSDDVQATIVLGVLKSEKENVSRLKYEALDLHIKLREVHNQIISSQNFIIDLHERGIEALQDDDEEGPKGARK